MAALDNALSQAGRQSVKSVLIIERNPHDAEQVAQAARELGAAQVEMITEFPAAERRFRQIARRQHPAPELIILNVDFGWDSGYELLRFCKANGASFKGTRIVVWANLTDREQKIVRYFGAEAVPKQAGDTQLKQSLAGSKGASAGEGEKGPT